MGLNIELHRFSGWLLRLIADVLLRHMLWNSTFLHSKKSKQCCEQMFKAVKVRHIKGINHVSGQQYSVNRASDEKRAWRQITHSSLKRIV
jgi:hypothetical protein